MKLSTIHRKVYSIAPKLTPKTTIRDIVNLLNTAFKRSPWIVFGHFIAKVSPTKHFTVNGLFWMVEDGTPDIGITLISSTAKRLGGSPEVYDRMLFEIFSTITHERLHMLQSQKAKGCPRKYQVKHIDPIVKFQMEYYGSNNEIDAYGQESALAMLYGYPDEINDRFRGIFSLDDPRYKRFLKKRWKHSIMIGAEINTLQLRNHHARSENTLQE